MNGLTGKVISWLTRKPRSEYIAWLLIQTEYGNKTVTLGEAERIIQLSWALSVHKAQGSSWETIIAVLPRHPKLLTRDMIYTALSCCEQRCICIISDMKAVTKAVEMPPVYETRRTRLFQ